MALSDFVMTISPTGCSEQVVGCVGKFHSNMANE